MPRFNVVFTEERLVNYAYEVDAEDAEQAYLIAEDRYFNYEEPDSQDCPTSKTIGHEIEEINYA